MRISLFVHDLDLATSFYELVLQQSVDIQRGQRVFDLPDGQLQLLASQGANEALGETVANPDHADGIPRVELTLASKRPAQLMQRIREAGGHVLSELEEKADRPLAGRAVDLDGHVLKVEQLQVAGVNWFERAHRAIGPVAAGLTLDFFDLLTPGPVGFYVGPIVGLVLGAYLASFYGIKGWTRAALAGIAAAYLAAPATSLIPLATLLSALSRMFQPKPKRVEI